MISANVFAADLLYSKLQVKTYDEMQKEIKARVQAAEKSGGDDAAEAKKTLKEALTLILSRPNSDNMVSQLSPLVRSPLKNLDAFEDVMSEITEVALLRLHDKSAKPEVKATNLFVLLNLMSELKPEVDSNPKVKAIFEKIRDENIVVGAEIKNELRMRSSIKSPPSPSEIAAKVVPAAKP
jgi:hypothetical protein